MATIIKFPGRATAPRPTAITEAAPPVNGSLALPMPVPVPKPAAPKVKPRPCDLTEAERLEAHRKDMLGKIHMARDWCLKNKKGYTEYIYRATLEDLYGVDTAAVLTLDQMHDLLLHFARLGWQKRPRKSRGKHAPNAYLSDTSGLNREGLLAKILKMLEEKAHAEGTDVPWAYAVAILKRQSGGVTKSLDQATREQLAYVISALWRDAKRKGRRVR